MISRQNKMAIRKIPGIAYGIVIVMIIFAFAARNFMNPANLENVLRNAAILLVISIGGTMAILAGKIDLSIGGIATFAGMIGGLYLKSCADPNAFNVFVSILITVAIGAVVGAFNGLMIGYQGYDNWLITFSTMSITFGLAQIVTGGNIVSGFNRTVRFIGGGEIFGIKVLLILAFVVVGIMIFVMHRTRFGMHIYAVGDSETCAQVSGVNVKKTLFMVYLLSGCFAGLCGFLLLSRTNSIGPTTGDGYEFNAIAAIIVGGTTFEGGKGGLGSTVFGALFITIVKNGLQLVGLSIFWQQACVGFFILGIILVNALNEMRTVKNAQRRIYHD